MDHKNVYLKPNIMAEPLINQWYAWSYLISPAAAPIYLVNYQLKVMESFIATPMVHQAASKNPAMIGGPFINYGAERVGDIKRLMEKTKSEQSLAIAFAAAIRQLNEMLEQQAKGFSMEPLYAQIPDILKGYVELTYDFNHHPSFRLLEGLLYKSPLYERDKQAMIFGQINHYNRPFVFSTPRVELEDHAHINLPFESEGYDTFFSMKQEPKPFGLIREQFRLDAHDVARFNDFFTETPPRKAEPYRGDQVRIRYISHACLLIESDGLVMLTDPVVDYEYESDIFHYTFNDLPERIDYVLISHNHQDHSMYETLLQLRHKIETVIVPKSGGNHLDPSLKLILKHIGFRNVVEVDELESIQDGSTTITSVPFLGEHCDLAIRTKTAYVVQVQGKTIYIGADSCNIEPKLYDHLHHIFGDFDVVFIGMECDGAPLTWMYGPLIINALSNSMYQSRKLNGSNFEQAADLIARLNPERVFVYAMGMEPWLVYLTSLQYESGDLPIVESDRLLEHCKRQKVPAERLFGHKEIFLS